MSSQTKRLVTLLLVLFLINCTSYFGAASAAGAIRRKRKKKYVIALPLSSESSHTKPHAYHTNYLQAVNTKYLARKLKKKSNTGNMMSRSSSSIKLERSRAGDHQTYELYRKIDYGNGSNGIITVGQNYK